MLTKEEKVQLVKIRLTNIESQKFNVELDISQEQSKTSPEESVILKKQAELVDLESQRNVLNDILNDLNK